MTCQSLHANPREGVAYAAEATLLRLSVEADGTYAGTFESKINVTPLVWSVSGSFTVGDECTLEGRLTPQGIPATVLARGVLFANGKEFLAIPMATQTPAATLLNAYDSCRAIRVGR